MKADQLQLGDRVRLGGGEYVVRGLSPRAVVPGRVILEHVETGERVEIGINKLEDPTAAAGRTAARRRSRG